MSTERTDRRALEQIVDSCETTDGNNSKPSSRGLITSVRSTVMTASTEWDIGAIFDEGTAVDEAMRNGWYRAVRRHRRLGIPLLVSEDGEIVELDPFEVELPDEEASMPDRDTYQRAGN